MLLLSVVKLVGQYTAGAIPAMFWNDCLRRCIACCLVRTALIGTDQGGWESAKEGLITLEPSYIQHDRRFIHLVNDVSRVDPRLAGIALQYLTDPVRDDRPTSELRITISSVEKLMPHK